MFEGDDLAAGRQHGHPTPQPHAAARSRCGGGQAATGEFGQHLPGGAIFPLSQFFRRSTSSSMSSVVRMHLMLLHHAGALQRRSPA